MVRPDDPVSVPDMLQAGVQGVVTALHHIPPGTIWPRSEIEKRQRQISHLSLGRLSGLKWAVVESLPVSEDIKTQSGDYRAHLTAWRDSLTNLAAAGITTVCYNFMPVLDWTRTDLAAQMPHGGHAMKFDLVAFAAFDLHILERPSAINEYDKALIGAAATYFDGLSDPERTRLKNNIVSGLPGANDNWTLDEERQRLASYDRIDATTLRRHLIDFLAEVVPLAETLGVNLCAHPDDPPFPLMGLPRILSTEADYLAMTSAVYVVNNGVTFCTGSLGVSADFDARSFLSKLAHRVHFAHLRNTMRIDPAFDGRTSFYEAAHLEGDTDMVGVLTVLLAEEKRRLNQGRTDAQIPFRPDHGQALLSDLRVNSTPGYPLIGRMRGLAELRGVMAGLGARI